MSSVRRVDSRKKPLQSRIPRDDELYVIQAFSRHASRCEDCINPVRTYASGRELCPIGNRKALDVIQYIYTEDGRPFSKPDHERNICTQIEISAEYESVRSLLKALDPGQQKLEQMQSHQDRSMQSHTIVERSSIGSACQVDINTESIHAPVLHSGGDRNFLQNLADSLGIKSKVAQEHELLMRLLSAGEVSKHTDRDEVA